MSYTHQNLDYWLTPAAGITLVATADPLTGAGVFRSGYQPYQCSAIYGLVVAVVPVTAATAVYKFRPLIGSAAGEFIVGSITFPIAAPVGNVYYKKLDSLKFPPGGELVVQITVAAGAATLVQFGALLNPTWDAPANNTKMIASA